MVNYFVILYAILIGVALGHDISEMAEMPDVPLSNTTSYTVILNSVDEQEAGLEQDLDLEQESDIDSEMILRDLDMSLYEYEQEILDDIN